MTAPAKPYEEFLRDKVAVDKLHGFEVAEGEINPLLKGHQRAMVRWAVRGGRRAIFASFGLGKSVCQLEILRLVLARVDGCGLIVCPLGVRAEFVRDAGMLGTAVRFVRRTDEVDEPGIYLTNYESVRDGKLDPDLFAAVSLDEASVLRDFGSKTYQSFLTLFRGARYRFVATATPSPNRYKELIHYAAFLGIMDSGQALTRWFQRDSSKANNLTLYPHKEREFWLWLSSWATFVQKPSDLGFSDDGYELPELDVRYHKVAVDHSDAPPERDGQGLLFRTGGKTLREHMRERRDTLPERVARLAELVAESPGDHFILWHHLEDERKAIARTVPGVSEVYGSLDLEERERRVAAFAAGESQLLATKPSLSGQGCNLQWHCHRAVFVGVGFEFEDFIQAIHRLHRFLQSNSVRIDVVYAESQQHVLDVLLRKWEEHKRLTETMSELIRESGLSSGGALETLTRTIGVERSETAGEGWLVAHNDCIPEVATMEGDSVDQIVTSIPFCYDETTEVLTRRGWLTFDRVSMDDGVATVHPTDLCIEWQRPTARVWERYGGEMLHFTGRSFDHMVTPNHRMLAARRSAEGFAPGQLQLVGAETIARTYERSQRRVQADGRILRGWRTCLVPPRRGDGKRPEHITIPPLPAGVRGGHGVQLYWIETQDFMRLVGWYLSEGHADPFDTGRSGGRISIAQTAVHQEFRDEIEAMFLRMGLPPSMHPNQLTVWCRNLAWFLRQEFGHAAAEKKVPTWVKELHPDLLEVLRDTMMKGDGSQALDSYASISPRLRDDFQEICLATGWRAALTGGKVVNLGQSQLFPEIRQAPRRVGYSGMIGCLTVPNHTLIVRRNGKAFVSGNSNHYEYTPSYHDLGHTDGPGNAHFWAQMDYLTPQLLRVLRPGRVYACHVKDRVLFGSVTGAGAPTISPFHAEAIMHGRRHGFDYLGMITVVTDVVRENNQTYRLGWSEQCKDGTRMGVGSPEYILLFRKPQTDRSRGYADVPVVKDKADYTRGRWQADAHALWRSSGNRLLSVDELAALRPDELSRVFAAQSLRQVYDHEATVRVAEQLDARGALPATFMTLAPGSHHPDVWADVNYLRTLNVDQRRGNRQMHICPLNFDIVDRLITRFSNPGELVFDPFGGLFTVPLRAVTLGRRGRAVELSGDYYADGVRYLRAHDREASVPTLFDLVSPEGDEVQSVDGVVGQ